MKKWNYKTKQYEEYTVPDSWRVKLGSNNLFEEINCAACGKSMIYGHGFFSRIIFDEHWFGYIVCYECHKKELKKERVSITDVQRNFLEAMNKCCEEKFDLSYLRTIDEASDYVDEHIDEYLSKASSQQGKEIFENVGKKSE